MRRKDKEMTKEFAVQVADKCEWATLAMITPENTPYCVPVSIARLGDFIYFHCAKEGRKIDCLKHCDDVCISCVGDTQRIAEEYTTRYESAVIFGKAFHVTEDEEKINALRAICQRHASTNMQGFDAAIERSLWRTDIWKISIETITGKCKR